MIEDQPHSRMAVDPQDVGGTEPEIVMLEHEAPAHGFGQGLPGLDPARVAGGAVPIGAPDMDHHDGLRPEFHQIEHLGLGNEVGDAPFDELRIRAVQNNELRRMERQAQVERLGLGAERGKLGRAVPHHGMELRHVGMGRIGREIRGHPVHRDPVLRQKVEDAVEVLQRDLEMRVLLPAPRIVALEFGRAQKS